MKHTFPLLLPPPHFHVWADRHRVVLPKKLKIDLYIHINNEGNWSATQYENWTFKEVLIKCLLEQGNWISGGVLGMTSFGPKKKKIIILFYFSWSPKKHSQPKQQPPNLIFFFSSMYFINPFSHLPTLNSAVGSILLRKWKPPWRCCVRAEMHTNSQA